YVDANVELGARNFVVLFERSVRRRHEVPEPGEVVVRNGANGGERALVLRHNVAAALAHPIAELVAELFNLRERHVAQRPYAGQSAAQYLDASLALGSTLVVLRAGELVLYTGVANHDEGSRWREVDELRLERTAVDQERMVDLAESGNEL